MSLIKLKSKKEPLYTSKSNVNFDEDLNETKLDTNKQLKEKSSLIIGQGATIKGEVKPAPKADQPLEKKNTGAPLENR